MRAYLLLGGAAIAFAASPVFAQSQASSATSGDAGQAPATADAQPQEGGLADIIVTAQRRSENMQRAAVAISAIGGSELVSRGVTVPDQLTKLVPALQVGAATGPYNVFYLRGVGNFTGNNFSEAAVAFNVDGVYVGRPSSTAGYFYDLERVEVLKGPQGTLYGRNATGGAINVITHRPELNKFSASASVDVGNYDSLRLEGMVNVPLGDHAAARLAAVRVKHDGYLNDGTDDQDDWGLRGTLRVEPASNFNITLSGDYFRQGGVGGGATPLAATAAGALAPTAFSLDQKIGLFSPQGQAFYSSQRNTLLGRNFYPVNSVTPGTYPYQHNEYWSLSATANWETNLGTLTVVPSYRVSDLNFMTMRNGLQVRQLEHDEQTSVETRFATPEHNPLRALVGFYYFNDQSRNPQVAYLHQTSGTYQKDYRLNTDSKAVFGRLTYEPIEGVRLVAGARQTWEDKTFTGDHLIITRICAPVPTATCPTAPPIPYSYDPPALGTFPSVLVPALGPAPYGGLPDVVGNPNLIQTATQFHIDRSASFSKFTWRVGADWDITPRNLVYASYETGFKAGGFFPTTGPGIYRPEQIGAYTLGSKNRFFSGKLRFNVEAFYWRYKDQQISHLGIDPTGGAIFATENVGRATFKGFEVELEGAATPTTTLSLDLQYLDAVYNNFVYTTPNQNGGFSNATGCPNAAPPTSIYVVDCSGKRPPNAPEWTLNLGVNQRIPVSFGEFALDARAHYQSKTLVGTEFLPVEDQKGYWITDASVTFNSPRSNYYLSLYANNVFNQSALQLVFPASFSSFFMGAQRPPRTFGIRLGYRY